jgi:poly-beta-hydroxyalkanoate depolymerase
MSQTTAELLAKARTHKMTPEERRKQRISLVMGMRGHASTLTKEKVQTLLEEIEGLPA